MKHLLLLVALLFPFISLGQDTLYEENSSMYSINYILNKNGTFSYSFWHCTGVSKGAGTYKKEWNSLVFHFDTIPKVKNDFAVSSDSTIKGVKIQILSTYDGDTVASPFSGGIIIRDKTGKQLINTAVDANGQYIYTGGEKNITIEQQTYSKDTLRVDAAANPGNCYTFYINQPFSQDVDGEVHTFKKAGKKYYKYRPRYRVNRWDEEIIRGRVKVWYVFKKPPTNL
jgi:hypothetical protein